MESQFFTYDGWDQQDTMAFTYYKIITAIELPGIPKGSKFSVADIDYATGKMRFWDDAGSSVLHEFKLKLQVV